MELKMQSENKNEKLIILILFCVQFTHILDFVLMMPLGPKLLRFFNITSHEFSYLVSSYAFAAAFCGLISSFFIDKYDRKKVLLFFYTGFLIGNFACALSTSFYTLIFGRILAGGFGGVLAGLSFSIVGDVVPEMRRGTATGTVMSAFGVASVIGIPLGLMIAEKFDWQAPFWAISILTILILILVSLKLPSMKEHISSDLNKNKFEFTHIINLFTGQNTRNALMLTVTYMMSGFLVIPFIGQYLVRNVGLLESQLSYMYFTGGLCTLLTSRIIGKMSDKHGKHKVLFIIGPLSIFPIIFITNLPPVPLYLVLIGSTLFFILISGRFVPLMSIITSSVSKKDRGAFMAINTSIQQIAMGLASTIAGFIISNSSDGKLQNFNKVGYLSCLMTFIFLLIARTVKIKND
jgi:predicted MFS family arabinose efflux permease